MPIFEIFLFLSPMRYNCFVSSKGKFLCCTACLCCLQCGSKNVCEHGDLEVEGKGLVSTFDLTHLLRKRYQLALLAAFGASQIKTVSLRDLSDRTVGKLGLAAYK
jgi:hypothetical protein